VLLLRLTQSKQSVEMLFDLPCVSVTHTVLRIREGMLDRCHYRKSAFTLPKLHEFASWNFGRVKAYNLFAIYLRKRSVVNLNCLEFLRFGISLIFKE